MPNVQELNLNYNAILPELCVIGAGLAIMMYDAFAPKGPRRAAGWIALAGLAGATYSVWRLWGLETAPSFNGMLLTDPLRLTFSIVFLLVAAVSVMFSMQMLDDERLPAGEYFTLLMFGTVGMLLMGGAGDLAMLFLGLETLSITTYVLAGFRRGDLRSNESALKYFILGSFSTGFLLYGMALTYGATKTTNLAGIQEAIATGALTSPGLLTVGAALMLVGFCFKIATAPFHFWAPDVYQGAPTPVTAFMAAGPKAAAFAAMLRIFVMTFPADGGDLSRATTGVLVIVAIMSMIVGNVAAIRQTDIKRMLAYSSIAHAGYALLGVVAGDWTSVMFYLLTYAVMNLGAFGVVSLLARVGDEKTEIEDFAGIGFKSFGLAMLLTVFLLSLGGIPLTAGFMGKLVIFKQCWQAGHTTLVIVAAVNSAVSLYYYLRPVVVMFFREREEEFVPPRVSTMAEVALTLALFGVIYLGVFPGRLLSELDRLAKRTPEAAQLNSQR
jgi:NADH-quinone oxidoreductase subunit N